MQATTMGGSKLEKRYSPSFRDDPIRKTAASKRKREEVLRLVEKGINLVKLSSFECFLARALLSDSEFCV